MAGLGTLVLNLSVVDDILASKLREASSAVMDFARGAIRSAATLESSMKGLQSVSNAFGVDAEKANKAAMSLAADGLISAADAAKAFKTALATGYSIEEATNLLSGLKEQAVFNRQAHYSMGEAVNAVVEGIKNENSTLSDATGTTKNLSVVYKEYAAQLGKSVNDLTQAEKRQAAYNGFLAEAKNSTGDLAKAQGTLAGQMAKTEAATESASASLGKTLEPQFKAINSLVTEAIGKFTTFTQEMPKVTQGLFAAAAAFTALSTAVTVTKSAIELFKISLGPVGIALAAISVAIAAATVAWSNYTEAQNKAAQAAENMKSTSAATRMEGLKSALQMAEDDLARKRRALEQQFQNSRALGQALTRTEEYNRVQELKAKIRATEAEIKLEEEKAAAKKKARDQEEKDEAARKAALEIRKQNMSEVQRLQIEMEEDLKAHAGASMEAIEQLRQAWLDKISKARQDANKEGQKAIKDEQEQIKDAMQDLIGMVFDFQAASREANAETIGVDPIIFNMQERARAIEEATDRAIQANGRILGMDTVTFSSKASREEYLDNALPEIAKARQAALHESLMMMIAETEEAAKKDYEAWKEAQVQKEADQRSSMVEVLSTEVDSHVYKNQQIESIERTSNERLKALADELSQYQQSLAVTDLRYDMLSEQERYDIKVKYAEMIAAKEAEIQKERLNKNMAITEAYLSDAQKVNNVFNEMTSNLSTVFGNMITANQEKLQADSDARQKMADGEVLSAEERASILSDLERDKLEESQERQKAAAVRLFRLQQAASIVGIVIDTASAVMKSVAQLGPIAGAIAGIGMGILGATQIAVVASQTPPTYHEGGKVGEQSGSGEYTPPKSSEMDTRLELGEYVVQKDAVNALGLPFLDSVNQTKGPLDAMMKFGPLALAGAPMAMFHEGGFVTDHAPVYNPDSAFSGLKTIQANRLRTLMPEAAQKSGGSQYGPQTKNENGKPIEITVKMDGSVIDKVIVNAMESGRGSSLRRELSRRSGTKTGIQR